MYVCIKQVYNQQTSHRKLTHYIWKHQYYCWTHNIGLIFYCFYNSFPRGCISSYIFLPSQFSHFRWFFYIAFPHASFCYPSVLLLSPVYPPLWDRQLLLPALFLLIDGTLNIVTYNEAKKPGINCHSLHPYRASINANLTYMWPCILIYFYSKTNQMRNTSIYFGIVNSTYFGRSLRPSSGVLRLYIQHQVYLMQILAAAC